MPTLTFRHNLHEWLMESLSTFEGEFGPGKITLAITEDLEVEAVIEPADDDLDDVVFIGGTTE